MDDFAKWQEKNDNRKLTEFLETITIQQKMADFFFNCNVFVNTQQEHFHIIRWILIGI